MFASRKKLKSHLSAMSLGSELPTPLAPRRGKQQKQAGNVFLASLMSQEIFDERPSSCWRIGCYHLGHCHSSVFQWKFEITFSLMCDLLLKTTNDKTGNQKIKSVFLLFVHEPHLNSLNLYFSICAKGNSKPGLPQHWAAVVTQWNDTRGSTLHTARDLAPIWFPFEVNKAQGKVP